MHTNISDMADKLVRTQLEKFEEKGYVFKVDWKGWSVEYQDKLVASGGSPRHPNGEQVLRQNRDSALHRARLHETEMNKPTEAPTEAPTPAPGISSDMAKKAVQAAVRLLQQAGALYRIEVGEEVFTNRVSEPRVYVRMQSHYLPYLEKHKDEMAWLESWVIPEEYDLERYRNAVSSYLRNNMRDSEYTSKIIVETRTIEVMLMPREAK